MFGLVCTHYQPFHIIANHSIMHGPFISLASLQLLKMTFIKIGNIQLIIEVKQMNTCTYSILAHQLVGGVDSSLSHKLCLFVCHSHSHFSCIFASAFCSEVFNLTRCQEFFETLRHVQKRYANKMQAKWQGHQKCMTISL